VSHLLTGGRHCAYRIAPAGPAHLAGTGREPGRLPAG
jgi:hypothetical protein